MKRWVASGGTFLVLFAFALPARAGLGESVEAVIEEPGSDLTASLEPVVVTGPLVEDLVETVEEVIAPPLTDVIAPVVTNPLPTPEVPARVTTNPPPTDNPPVHKPVNVAPVAEAPLPAPIEISSSQGALLTSISNAALPPDDHQSNDAVDNQTPWLHALTAWLESGLSGLFDVLAIPARFLELLFRALISAGSGLVAPAAILAALAATSRRRLLPAS
jgi:hypothetical protein